MTDPIRGWLEIFGGIGDDADLAGQFRTIVYGGPGDDHLIATGFVADQALAGGSGNDAYSIQPNSLVWVVEGSGSTQDLISALWTTDSFTGQLTAIEGRHWLLEDPVIGTTVIFVNGLRAENFIETWQLFDGIFSWPEIVAILASPETIQFEADGSIIPDEGAINLAWEDYAGPIQGPILRDFADYLQANSLLLETELALGQASDQADNLLGTPGDDLIRALAGDDTVRAAAGADLIYGNQGRDLIYGNPGTDKIYGGQGEDRIYGGQDSDIIYGNVEHDIVYGNIAADVLYGGQGNDLLYGGQGADILFGNQGNDTIYGNLSDDVIDGGAGSDRLHGGGGKDLLVGGSSGAGNEDWYFHQGDETYMGGIGAVDHFTLNTSGAGSQRLDIHHFDYAEGDDLIFFSEAERAEALTSLRQSGDDAIFDLLGGSGAQSLEVILYGVNAAGLADNAGEAMLIF